MPADTPPDVGIGEVYRLLTKHLAQYERDQSDLRRRLDEIPSQREFELSQATQDQAIGAVAEEISTVRTWVKGVVLAMLGGAFTLAAGAVLLVAPGGGS